MIVGHDARPTSRMELAEELDGEGEGAPGCGVTCSHPIELMTESGRIPKRNRPTMADDEGGEILLAIGANVEDRTPLRCAEPFVGIGDGIRGTKIIEVEIEQPDAVSRIKQRLGCPCARVPRSRGSKGMRRPVGLVTVSSIASAVRSVTASRTRSITTSGPSMGKGISTVTTRAFDLEAT